MAEPFRAEGGKKFDPKALERTIDVAFDEDGVADAEPVSRDEDDHVADDEGDLAEEV